MTQACGAVLPRQRDPGWECTGAGLIVVLTLKNDQRTPVVLPARALEVVDPEEWWELPVTRFTGGDHLHLAVPRRPTTFPFRNDTVFLDGDTAVPWKFVGLVDGIGQMWMSRGVNGETGLR